MKSWLKLSWLELRAAAGEGAVALAGVGAPNARVAIEGAG